jgi:hypothetical protein
MVVDKNKISCVLDQRWRKTISFRVSHMKQRPTLSTKVLFVSLLDYISWIMIEQ